MRKENEKEQNKEKRGTKDYKATRTKDFLSPSPKKVLWALT